MMLFELAGLSLAKRAETENNTYRNFFTAKKLVVFLQSK
jgi:hypothetical protein